LELVEVAESDQKNRLQRLRQKGKAADRLWSRDPSGLASDYQALTREILSRVANAERDRVAGGVACAPRSDVPHLTRTHSTI
jgi:hypothetical protein